MKRPNRQMKQIMKIPQMDNSTAFFSWGRNKRDSLPAKEQNSWSNTLTQRYNWQILLSTKVILKYNRTEFISSHLYWWLKQNLINKLYQHAHHAKQIHGHLSPTEANALTWDKMYLHLSYNLKWHVSYFMWPCIRLDYFHHCDASQ